MLVKWVWYNYKTFLTKVNNCRFCGNIAPCCKHQAKKEEKNNADQCSFIQTSEEALEKKTSVQSVFSHDLTIQSAKLTVVADCEGALFWNCWVTG